MNEIEERWRAIGMECDLCKRLKQKDEHWWDTHTNAGICGFTFNFCTECERDRQRECDEVMAKVLTEHRRRTKEYWDTHPEELEKHRRETEEYRKTLVEYDHDLWLPPGNIHAKKLPLWKRIWKWIFPKPKPWERQ